MCNKAHVGCVADDWWNPWLTRSGVNSQTAVGYPVVVLVQHHRDDSACAHV